ncbi:HlyD family efflux transporter periplasmic adaptor subunit [bacterium]|nr:HlyD family efflux transporter periplasmic adaptor subunit [bacterium]
MTVWGQVLAFFAALLPGTAPTGFNGYLEADYVYLAPLSAGRITEIDAAEGDPVREGQVLARLDDQAQVAALSGAEAAVAQAKANLENLSTGSREAEIAVIRASLHKAQADRDLAEATLERTLQLSGQGQVSAAKVDQDRAAAQAAGAQVEQLSAQLNVAQLPARDAQRTAAEAALAVVQAQADAARIALADRVLKAPISGVLDRSFYQVGEVAASGAPVLALFDPGKIKAIFFVPEAARAQIAPGKRFAVTCDGCAGGLATVTRLASEPQYTPPILYSRDERGRLVFRAEALVEGVSGLQPGQPVTLEPLP